MSGLSRGTVVALGVLVAIVSGEQRGGVPESMTVLEVAGRSSATPTVAAEDGFVAVAWGATLPGGGTDVMVAVSRDAGSTFGAPVRVNEDQGTARLGGEMPPRLALRPRPAGDPEILVLWTSRASATEIRLSRSGDGGRRFAEAVSIQSPGAPGDRGWPALALDRAGVAHLVWLDHRGLAADSTRAGHSHDTHQPGAATRAGETGDAIAQRSGLFYASASGAPFEERELVRGVCYCCKTALAAAPNGTLFAAWRHVYPGNLRDIAVIRSSDGGRTFEPATRVSQDRWQLDGCPDDGPALAVDRAGAAHVVWPTVLDSPEPRGALFHATTRDGRSFTPRIRIPTLGGPKPAHPQLVVGPDGRLFVAWDERARGRRTSAVREIRVSGTPEFGPVMELDTGAPGVYPVLAAVRGGLVAVWTRPGLDGRSAVVAKRLEPPAWQREP